MDAIRVKDMSTYIGSTPRDNRIGYLKGFQTDARIRRRVWIRTVNEVFIVQNESGVIGTRMSSWKSTLLDSIS